MTNVHWGYDPLPEEPPPCSDGDRAIVAAARAYVAASDHADEIGNVLSTTDADAEAADDAYGDATDAVEWAYLALHYAVAAHPEARP